MYDYTAQVLIVLACLLVLGTVLMYESHIRRLRTERDEAIADCELFSQLLIEADARHRHPSTPSNVRVLRGVQ